MFRNKKNTEVENILLYFAPGCAHCLAAKRFFETHNIPFEEIDVTQNKKILEEVEEKTHQKGVPVIEAGPRIFVGFDRKELEEFLGLTKGRQKFI